MTVRLADGVLTIAAHDYDAWLAGADAVVLLREAHALCVIPVRHGGALVKIKNGARDRAIDVRDVLREHGNETNEASGERVARWDAARAALVVAEVFA